MKIDKKLLNYDIYLFDFDGTLLNSEVCHLKAHNLVLNEILGKEINLTKEMFQKYIGKKDEEIFEVYKQDFNVDFNKQEMIAKKVEYAKNLLCSVEVKIYPYFLELAQNKGKRRFFIASNQNSNLLVDVLKEKDILKFFDGVFSFPKMGIEKEYFLKNIKKFIKNCNEKIVLFEDSNKVLEIANNCQIYSVGIENEFNKNKLKNANLIINCENQ